MNNYRIPSKADNYKTAFGGVKSKKETNNTILAAVNRV